MTDAISDRLVLKFLHKIAESYRFEKRGKESVERLFSSNKFKGFGRQASGLVLITGTG